MHGWPAERIAAEAGARLERPVSGGSPARVVIDSREAGPGDLFVGLVGSSADGGAFATEALTQGAWGVLIGPGHDPEGTGAVLVANDPLGALQRLATAWRRSLGVPVVAITGSTGKTSTKDVLAAMLAPSRRVLATPENLNTEIGLPLTILRALPETEVLVLEMAMRGIGQIAELTAIAEPQIGVITNVGPVHLELMESIDAIAAAKAELIAGLPAGGTAIVPSDEPLLDPYLRDDLEIVRFGATTQLPTSIELRVDGAGTPSAHMLRNAQAALAAANALGVEVDGVVDVSLSSMRGQRVQLDGGIVVVNDCYNANPMSMRAALDDLSASANGRRVAVLGDMLELGPEEIDFHRQIGEHARSSGVDLLVTVGQLAEHMGGDHAVGAAAEAAELLSGLLQRGDTVLIKGSRGVGLEAILQELSTNG